MHRNVPQNALFPSSITTQTPLQCETQTVLPNPNINSIYLYDTR